MKHISQAYRAKMWQNIEKMGWGKKSSDYEKISQTFFSLWGKETMEKISTFVHLLVQELQIRVTNYEDETYHDLGIVKPSDGFDDVCYHIVGLGRAEYEKAYIDPELVEQRYLSRYGSPQGYKESFAYCFNEPKNPLPKLWVQCSNCHRYLTVKEITPTHLEVSPCPCHNHKKGEHIISTVTGLCVRCGCDEDDVNIGNVKCID